MSRLIIVLLACSSLAWSQSAAVGSNSPLPASRLEKGSVQGNTYKNACIGLELTPPSELKFVAPELKKKPASLSVAARGKFKAGLARDGAAFWAIESASYPSDQRSKSFFTQKVVEANQKNGFKVVSSDPESTWEGISFARTDFSHNDPAGYEVVFVKACDAWAIGFVFSGSNQAAVNTLISATEMKLDPATAGCAQKGKEYP
jgi:hypothetical protein